MKCYLLLCICLFSPLSLLRAQEVYYPDSTSQDTVIKVNWLERFQTKADSVIRHSDLCQTSQTGIYFYNLTADSAIFDYGSRQMMRPASVTKTLTATAALHYLGGHYQYKTKLYYKGHIQDSLLLGDIYIVAGYDPCFNGKDMLTFCDDIIKSGIDSICGHIYTDVSFKDTTLLGFGWLWNWKNDEKPTTPLLFDADDCFMTKFFELMDSNGIKHPSTYSNALLPKDSAVLISECQHTIDEVLLRMLKQSDNQYAESLFFQLGAQDKSKFPSYQHSAKYVLNFIENELGDDADLYNISDGSGLSVYDCVSPRLIVKLLRYIYKHENIYRHFYPCLPIGGEDGTLSNRMKSPALRGNIHAKTGTLKRVVTLAGYCTAPNGDDIAFAIFHNGIYSPRATRLWDDHLLEFLTAPETPSEIMN